MPSRSTLHFNSVPPKHRLPSKGDTSRRWRRGGSQGYSSLPSSPLKFRAGGHSASGSSPQGSPLGFCSFPLLVSLGLVKLVLGDCTLP